MATLPTIETERLLLRPFGDADAREVQRLAGDRRIAATTMLVPHPYEDGVAEAWIATHEASWEAGLGLVLAIVLKPAGPLVGTIGLSLKREHVSAELGYWVGVPWWGRGIATEAARAMVDFAFRELGMHRVHAHHFVRNIASGRVLEKCGMREEGVHRDAVRKWGRFEDVRFWAILRPEWEARQGAGPGR